MRTVYIYALALSDGRSYVGSTFNPELRRKAHFALLRRNAHHSPRLQNAWNKYGEGAFLFSVLETTECADIADRVAVEAKWAALHGSLNTARSTNGITFEKSPKFMSVLRATIAKRRADPEYRPAVADWIRTTDGKSWLVSRNKAWWDVPENRNRMRQKALERCTPEFMAKCRTAGMGQQTEAVKERRRERMTVRMADPAERTRASERASRMMVERGIANVERAITEERPLTRSQMRTGKKYLDRLSARAAAVVIAANRPRNQRVASAREQYLFASYPPQAGERQSED